MLESWESWNGRGWIGYGLKCDQDGIEREGGVVEDVEMLPRIELNIKSS